MACVCVTRGIFSPGRSSPVQAGRGALAARFPQNPGHCNFMQLDPTCASSVAFSQALSVGGQVSESITSSGWLGRSHGW